MTTKNHTDFLIIGAGIIGLSLARVLRKHYPKEKITIIEKEPHCGAHASGRNSGVLHAGFYYTPDSLKAQLTRDGNQQMTDYCKTLGLTLNPCGKLVVTKDESELSTLQLLFNRGQANKVPLEMISTQQAKQIEPTVKTHQKALWSPTTSTVDPKQVVTTLVKEITDLNIKIITNAKYLSHKKQQIETTQGIWHAGYLINTAGLYADKIAHEYGFGKNYRILPFKGLYLYSSEPPNQLKTHIYPVPNLKQPFLGVHYTISATGQTKIGPTAIPIGWREHYQGLSGFNLKESVEILTTELGLFFNNTFGFKKLAYQESLKYSKSYLVKQAQKLREDSHPAKEWTWGKPGIRAQLVDLKNRSLEMDFCHQGDQHSFHVLNAVSPAFTCAFSFADYLLTQIHNTLNK